MIQTPSWLYLPYIANIVILVPVCWSLFMSGDTVGVFEGKIEDSPGLRVLIASLYLAILVASIGGLAAPEFFAPLILIQVFYKTCWLCAYTVPQLMNDNPIPNGITIAFVAIVLSYPIFFWLASR